MRILIKTPDDDSFVDSTYRNQVDTRYLQGSDYIAPSHTVNADSSDIDLVGRRKSVAKNGEGFIVKSRKKNATAGQCGCALQELTTSNHIQVFYRVKRRH